VVVLVGVVVVLVGVVVVVVGHKKQSYFNSNGNSKKPLY
jgi:hypothetical protein